MFLWLRVDALRYHVIAMGVAQCLTAFFAVWTVHHDTADARYPARTQRGRLRNFVSYHMFLHVEHHLFPQVPTCHLPTLARRLDRVMPDLQSEASTTILSLRPGLRVHHKVTKTTKMRSGDAVASFVSL